MFDIAWTEILIIGVVALVVIGPKDLPRVLRTVGQWVGRARAMAREFQNGLDEMVRESELDEIRKKMNDAGMAADPRGIVEEATRPLNEALEAPALPETVLPPPGEGLTPPTPEAAPAEAADTPESQGRPRP